eukprot:3526805-Amphidinium_carterae.1
MSGRLCLPRSVLDASQRPCCGQKMGSSHTQCVTLHVGHKESLQTSKSFHQFPWNNSINGFPLAIALKPLAADWTRLYVVYQRIDYSIRVLFFHIGKLVLYFETRLPSLDAVLGASTFV